MCWLQVPSASAGMLGYSLLVSFVLCNTLFCPVASVKCRAEHEELFLDLEEDKQVGS